MLVLYIFLSILCLAPGLVQAEPLVEIDKIIVTESLSKDQPGQVSPSSVLEVKTTEPKFESAASVLSQTAGVHLRRFGGLEAATSVSIRGSSHEQVNVFLDGVPLNSASGGGVSLSQIQSQSLSKIEVYKSLAPTELGGLAMGGAIHLKSKKIEAGLHQRFGLGLGSFLTLDAMAEFMRGGDDHDIVMGINYRRTKGDFYFFDDNGTPVNPNDDQRVRRQNNEHQLIHPYLKWIHRPDTRTQIQWSHHLFRKDSGVPGLGAFQSLNTDLSSTEYLSSFQISRDGFLKGKANFSNNLYGRWINSQFSDPNGEIGLGATQDNDNNTYVIGDRFVWQTNFSENITLKTGLELVAEWFTPTDYAAATTVGSTSTRYQANVTVEPHVYLLDKKIHLSAMGQSLNSFYNVNDTDPSLAGGGTFFSDRTEPEWTGLLSVQYSPVKNIHFKSSFGRVIRLPQFLEMFGDQGAVLGNPQLVSEKSLKFDVGVKWSRQSDSWLKRAQLEVNYFESHVDDLIQFEASNGLARASNIGKATLRGFELMALTKITKHVNFSANYTFQLPKNKAGNSGNHLVGRPTHEFSADLDFKKGSFMAGVDVNYVDKQYLDTLNTQVVRNRILLNGDVGYFIKEKVRLGVEVKNITNSQVLDSVGFPLPGRSYFGRLDLYF